MMWALLALCFLGIAYADVPLPFASISLSSQYNNPNPFPASFCNDGDINTFCHTDWQRFPFVDIDLGASKYVTGITVTNRQDCCQDRAFNVWFFGKDSPWINTWSASDANPEPIAQACSREASYKATFIFQSGLPTFERSLSNVFRYLRVVMFHSSYEPLNLAEIQVFTPSVYQGLPVIAEISFWVGGSSRDDVPDGWDAVPCDGTCGNVVNMDLNKGTGGSTPYIYMYYKKLPFSMAEAFYQWFSLQSDRDFIKAANCYGIYNGEVTLKGMNGLSQDFNQGAGGDYIYICAIRKNGVVLAPSTMGFWALTALRLHEGSIQSITPLGPSTWTSGDLNKNAGGSYIYLQANQTLFTHPNF